MANLKKVSLDLAKKIKNKKDKIILPIIKILDSLNLSPNNLTNMALVLGILAAILLIYSKILFFIFILIAFLFDILDGSLARYQKKVSKKGWWKDYLSDRIIMIAVIVSSIFIVKTTAIILLTLYLLVNIVYTFIKEKTQIIYFEIIYYILILININFATNFAIIISIINILILILASTKIFIKRIK